MDYGELHRIQGLLATLAHQGWDCRGHGDSEGLQGTMVAYRGTAGSESCGLKELYYNFCRWQAWKTMFRRTALAKYNIIVPRPHGSGPGSQPTRDCEGRRVTTERLSLEGLLEYGRCREYTGLGGTAEHAGEYNRLPGIT